MATALIVLAVLAAFIAREHMREKAFQSERSAWTRERNALIGRIQHPDVIPIDPIRVIPEAERQPPLPPDEYDKIGTVESGFEES